MKNKILLSLSYIWAWLIGICDSIISIRYWFEKNHCSRCDEVVARKKIFCSACDAIIKRRIKMTFEEKHALQEKLLVNIKESLPDLQILLKKYSDHWHYEDPVYRFYHGSFKVFKIQEHTTAIVEALKQLAPPDTHLNMAFIKIFRQGTGKEFSLNDNYRWLETTGPIVVAFFHARFMLEMACRYGETLSHHPDTLPSGWAALLCLYDLR